MTRDPLLAVSLLAWELAVGDAINPPATRGWSFSRDIQNRLDPRKGSLGNWLATGPDAGAAAGATGFSGSGIVQFLKSLTGGC